MKLLEIQLEDIRLRYSLRKFVTPHPLRDRLCPWRHMYIPRYKDTKVLASA